VDAEGRCWECLNGPGSKNLGARERHSGVSFAMCNMYYVQFHAMQVVNHNIPKSPCRYLLTSQPDKVMYNAGRLRSNP
jgi:hypothetical protein